MNTAGVRVEIISLCKSTDLFSINTVISVNRDLNYDSNGFKIMKNGPYDQKLWSFLVLKVLRKLYQLVVTQ